MPKTLKTFLNFFVALLFINLGCLFFINAKPANGQYFINKSTPQIQTPHINVPNNGPFSRGFAFDFIPPHKAQNSMTLDVWEKVKNGEKKRPTFYDGDLDIADAAIAKQWGRLYNLAVNRDLKTKLKYVNHFFNQWPSVTDEELWLTEDYWANPWEFMDKGGDCEDYVIAKFYALKALGVAPEKMCIVVVDDFKAMITHVVLAIMEGRDFYVLDNLTDKIYKNSAGEKYVPRYFINEDNVWRPLNN